MDVIEPVEFDPNKSKGWGQYLAQNFGIKDAHEDSQTSCVVVLKDGNQIVIKDNELEANLSKHHTANTEYLINFKAWQRDGKVESYRAVANDTSKVQEFVLTKKMNMPRVEVVIHQYLV